MSRAIGPDISFYQDDNATEERIDFGTMKDASEYVIIRAGQNYWHDPDFYYNWQASKEAGLPRGSYWFYDSRSKPADQARWYFEALGGDYGELPLFADYEENYGGPYGSASHFHTFIRELERLIPGKEIMIYTGYYFWRERVSPEDRNLFKNYALWIARYSESEPWVPEPWDNWTFWQYTAVGDGPAYGVESKGIDLNYYNGTAEEFRARFGIGEVEPPPVDPPPTGEDMTDALLEVAKQIGRVADAIENLEVITPQPPTDPPTDPPPVDPPSEYPKSWQLINPQKSGNVPFFRNPDVNTNKIGIWKENVVKEHMPPERFYNDAADLFNLMKDWAWIKSSVVYNAGGKAKMMPRDFETTTGKSTDNWYGGGFVERNRLQKA